jgi:hypothetical protein
MYMLGPTVITILRVVFSACRTRDNQLMTDIGTGCDKLISVAEGLTKL